MVTTAVSWVAQHFRLQITPENKRETFGLYLGRLFYSPSDKYAIRWASVSTLPLLVNQKTTPETFPLENL